jgi:hypothetical protein
MRGLVAWLLTLPLAAGGLFLAHELSYRATEPHAHERQALLERTGHGYFDYAPIAAAIGASLLLAALALTAARAFRGAAALRIRLLPFAAVSPLAFVVLEFSERQVHFGEISLSTALEPTFVLGLLLQSPFALAAVLLARALLLVAERFGGLLALAPPAFETSLVVPGLLRADLGRRSVLGRGYAGRAPPALLAV